MAPPPPKTEPITALLVPVDQLRFDDQNPRLAEEGPGTTQDEILRILWRDFAVDEVALSIAQNGYFAYEPVFAAREGNDLVVIEGNRRLAAVKLLRDSALRKQVGATDLPTISQARRTALDAIPVVERTREEIWEYIGFKHVNGPQAWESYSKAEYIAWVHNTLNVPLDRIAKNIGDRHLTVRRLYRAWQALAQGQKAGVFRVEDRAKGHFSFSHLYTGFDYSGVQSFTGISKDYDAKNPIPKAKLAQFGELCEWLFGSKSREMKPVVRSQNPDLRQLDEVLQSRDGIAALRSGLPLGVALDISKGDERLFRESLVEAKNALQSARGKLLTGYRGESDLLATAEDILELADRIVQEMREQWQDTESPRSRSRSRS